MQSNSKGCRHIKVRDNRNEWLADMPKSWRPVVLRQTRRRLTRQDMALEYELEYNKTDWWMFPELDCDHGQADYWYHQWLQDEVRKLGHGSLKNPAFNGR